MISVVLIGPANSGNVGAIARAMANFDLSNLVLINPKCNHLSQAARNRAKNAQEILHKAKVASFSYLKKLDYVIGTTAKLGTDYNIPRSPLTPEKLAGLLRGKESLKVGIVFGREANGLTNEEVRMCDFIVNIPTSKEYAALNISHAAAIVFYELFKEQAVKAMDEKYRLAGKEEKQLILGLIEKLLDKTGFSTKEKKETQRRVWKRLVGKSFMTKREAYALIGFLKKL